MNVEKILERVKQETQLEFDSEEFGEALKELVESGPGDRIVWCTNATEDSDDGEYSLVRSTNNIILLVNVVGTIDLDEEKAL